ncbi:Ku protein [Streptomyces spongiae]|uniref:Ku domain-containing protein n=1 Tax=Streptomyces spongiae TaxID=565072 RepID=A0A5N8XUS8_9ACTN|nr:hypothetical protein [Streptomyces spongiae]
MAVSTIVRMPITFGLVSIPVTVHAATEQRSTGLKQVHAKDGSRIRLRRYCDAEGVEVPYVEVVRGFEAPGGHVVVLTDEDLSDLPLPTATPCSGRRGAARPRRGPDGHAPGRRGSRPRRPRHLAVRRWPGHEEGHAEVSAPERLINGPAAGGPSGDDVARVFSDGAASGRRLRQDHRSARSAALSETGIRGRPGRGSR